jgi:antitoxin component of MazEF toxin-antitoxin module
MIATIIRTGDSQGIILDPDFLKLARLQVGDEIEIEVQANRTILVKPVATNSQKSSPTSAS